jgi:hypothetical protein
VTAMESSFFPFSSFFTSTFIDTLSYALLFCCFAIFRPIAKNPTALYPA